MRIGNSGVDNCNDNYSSCTILQTLNFQQKAETMKADLS